MTATGTSAWLIGLGRVSAEAGILVLVVLLVQTLLRKQLPPRWRCALWLLVVIRLLLPVSLGSALSIFNIVPHLRPSPLESPPPSHTASALPNRAAPLNSPAPAPTQAPSDLSLAPVDESVPERSMSPAPGQMQPAKPSVLMQARPATHASRFSWARMIFVVWLGGALLLVVYVAAGSIRLRRRLANLPAVNDNAVTESLTECSRLLGVRARLTVVESSGISTPALHGLFRLRLLLPQGFARTFSPAELRFVLLHELAHVKRGDIPLNWLVTFLQVVHWFNPLLWFGFARWRADRELACDALALEAAGPGLNKEYGRTILKLLDGFTHRVAAPGLVGILEDKRRLRQRIGMIASFRPNNRWRFASALLLVALGVVCLTDAQGPKSSVTNGAATGPNVSVTVVDEQGRPVSGATVGYYEYQKSLTFMGSMSRTPGLKQQTVTDAQGRFAVAASPKGNLVVIKKAGLAPAWRNWPYDGSDPSEPLVLTAPTTLSGVVSDPNGRPVANAEVWVSAASFAVPGSRFSQLNDIAGPLAHECFSARTTADGRFRIENFPAEARAALTVAKPGMAQQVTTGHYFTAHEFRSGQQNIKLLLGPAGAIEGKVVVQETGQPVANVEVWMLPTTGAGATHGPARSGADGTFRIPDLQPATYSVRPIMPGQPAELVEVRSDRLATVAAGQTNRDVLIRATTGVLVEVSVVSTNDLKPVATVAVSSGQSSGYTDDSGRTVLRITPGKAWFSASKFDWSPRNTTAEIQSDRTNQVLIQMIPPPRITGIVRDAMGQPAPDVRVSFHPGQYPMAPYYAETRTDRNGRYEMTIRQESRGFFDWSGPINPTNFVMAQDFVRNLVAIEVFGTTNHNEMGTIPSKLDLNLKPGITLSGSVKDTRGAPVTSALIDLKILTGGSFGSVEDRPPKVDARGAFSLLALPRGWQYIISDLTAKGYGTAFGFVEEVNTSTNYEFPTFVLKRTDRILQGTVLGRDGKPVAGASIEVNGPGQLPLRGFESDDQGHFRINAVCEGEVQVVARDVRDPDYRERGDVSAQGGDTNVVIRLGIFGYRAGRFLSEPLKTTGTVRDPSGTAVAGATVSLFPVDSPPVTSRTDADGRYELHWQARLQGTEESLWLLARDHAHNLVALQQIDGQPTNVDLTLQAGLMLSTQVRDRDGMAVSNATAEVSLWVGNRGYSVEGKRFPVDDRGQLQIAGLPQGHAYWVQVEAPGHNSAMLQSPAGDTQTNFLELPAAVLDATDSKVSGQVLGIDGQPAAGIDLTLFATGQTGKRTTTDSNGRFFFKEVLRGPVSISAGLPARGVFASYKGSVRTTGGDTNVVIQLEANNARTTTNTTVKTSGTVFDSSGAPAAGVFLSVLRSSGPNAPVQTDASGKYSLSWETLFINSPMWTSSPGKVVMFARDVTNNLAATAEADAATTNLDLYLLPGLTLSGAVRDTDGYPVTNATVQVVPHPPSDRRSAMNRMPPMNVDGQGRFSINALAQGVPYDLNVTALGYGLNNIQIPASDTKTTQFELPTVVLKIANRQVSGQVLGPDGKPCWGARITVIGDGQPASSPGGGASSDAGGHFVVRQICDGPLVVRAMLPASVTNPQYLVSTVEARGGDTNVVLYLRKP